MWLGFLYSITLYAGDTASPPMCYADVKDAYTALMRQHQKSQIININTASVVDFLQLTGVGNQTAQAIIAYRNQHGRFDSINDLQKVRGIGHSTIDKNRHRLTVATTD